jgi:hypothetical protein
MSPGARAPPNTRNAEAGAPRARPQNGAQKASWKLPKGGPLRTWGIFRAGKVPLWALSVGARGPLSIGALAFQVRSPGRGKATMCPEAWVPLRAPGPAPRSWAPGSGALASWGGAGARVLRGRPGLYGKGPALGGRCSLGTGAPQTPGPPRLEPPRRASKWSGEGLVQTTQGGTLTAPGLCGSLGGPWGPSPPGFLAPVPRVRVRGPGVLGWAWRPGPPGPAWIVRKGAGPRRTMSPGARAPPNTRNAEAGAPRARPQNGAQKVSWKLPKGGPLRTWGIFRAGKVPLWALSVGARGPLSIGALAFQVPSPGRGKGAMCPEAWVPLCAVQGWANWSARHVRDASWQRLAVAVSPRCALGVGAHG